MFESEVNRRRVRLQAVRDQELDYRTTGLEPVLNDRTRRDALPSPLLNSLEGSTM